MFPASLIRLTIEWTKPLLLLATVFFISFGMDGQQQAESFPEEYDEFFVFLSVENLGYYEIDAIYAEDELYLPFLDLCNKLSIYTEASARLDTISGYMADRQKTFELNLNTNAFRYMDRQVEATPRDYLLSYGDVFVSARVYKALFGFSMQLDFRSLMVRLQSDTELPIVKILKQQKLRENLKSLQGEIKVDTVIDRRFHLARGGVLDWNLRLAQSSATAPTAQFRGALGTEFMGGELVVRSAISSEAKPDWRNQSFRWRFVNDASPVIRQVNAGFIGVPLNSQVTTPLIGMGISNTPAGFRSSYGSMMLRRTTQPGWEVEVFVNNVLVAYTTADANGDVQIEIPLMYGSTEIQIRYYGPWGEEEIEEQSLVIPFVFVPQGKLEYQAFSGVTADTLNHAFAFARLAYGLNRRTTLFAGHEFFDRNAVSRTMPFAAASVVVTEGLLMNYQFVNGAYQSGSFLWRSGKGFFLEGRAKLYQANQDAELNNNLREYTSSFNLPFRLGKTRWMTRGQYRQVELPSTITRFTEATAAVFYKRFNGGLTTGASMGGNAQYYSALNAAIQLPRQWSLQGGMNYAFPAAEMTDLRLLVQKRFKRRVVVNLNANGLHHLPTSSVNLNVFIDLGWMGFSGDASHSEGQWKSGQNFNGSTLIGRSPNRFQTNTRSTMGRGAVDAMVYLDINHNNTKDSDEPLLTGISVAMNRGVETLLENDSVFRFVALEPYTRHLITVSESGLREISWRLPYTTIGVFADPNSVKRVYIPVVAMGEIEGQVTRLDENGRQLPAPRIPITIYSESGQFIARVTSDASGYFNYAELKPGVYTVVPDQDALARANLVSTDARAVRIAASANGDFLQGVDFVVVSTASDSE